MKQQILEEIHQNNTIIIHRHVRPDPDAYGSQCGLAEVLKASYPEKNIFVVGESEPSLEFLYKMDLVDDDVYQEALVIVCDTANQARVSDQRYKNGKKLIKIDHHPNEDKYGDLLWVDTTAAATSEMIYELFLEGKEQGLVLSKKAAQLLYAGIVGDTGRFLFPSTTEKTFGYASALISEGIEFTPLYNELYKTKRNVAKLSGYVLQNFTLTSSGAASMNISREILTEYEVTPSEASQLVGILGNIEGVISWVFFVEEENQIRVRLRSKGPVINELARKYNGGGHPLASGASIYNWEEAVQVLKDLEELCQDY
ncbi:MULTISPECIES: DHH family phosphoesterase [Metabacillus]|jgi:bifunctional oligoribonuclease and PAP phosphatase NrnA|uniref:Oligoribonuclease n=3 Tax=Metabacillus TaxID=2675233 RepID=A0A179T4C2_9BACI|nr:MULTISPECIES: bifunctional oligoribonuclease/PAP phosphatase NrnA [Metabacillus]OAS88795.1 oligoribonuclease [Metabacillus litoralis]QNF26482.1 bifunctional oligoribonuclease/PAP phosphatase NrnA [Metabacillus sp. KUDC1714]